MRGNAAPLPARPYSPESARLCFLIYTYPLQSVLCRGYDFASLFFIRPCCNGPSRPLPSLRTREAVVAIVMRRHITMNKSGSLSEGAGAKRLKESAVDKRQLSLEAAARNNSDSFRHRLAAMPPPSRREAFHDNDGEGRPGLFHSDEGLSLPATGRSPRRRRHCPAPGGGSP